MTNQFYNGFDTETFTTRPRREEEHRTPFQIDRDRIIHTSTFRSLQSKTQVFLSGEYDFYRTRLTHSIEVAQIGRAICGWLQHRSPLLDDGCFIDPDLVEASCLAHDLGHPPFGHRGERTLNRLMTAWGGFEGNAQTLRLLTQTIFDGQGMAPTRALLDGILKYKTLHAELDRPERHFIYSDQDEILDFVLAGRDFPAELTPGPQRNRFRSIECQIMDWADDAAYSLHDLADGIHAGFITIQHLERWAADQPDPERSGPILDDLLRLIRDDRVESRIGRKIGQFISACSLDENPGFMSPMTNRHRFALRIDPDAALECHVYKRIAVDLLFRVPQLQQLDHKADFILERLFGVFDRLYIRPESQRKPEVHLLAPKQEALLAEAPSEAARARLVCDFIAELSDAHATRVYKRLFDPGYGSILDLL